MSTKFFLQFALVLKLGDILSGKYLLVEIGGTPNDSEYQLLPSRYNSLTVDFEKHSRAGKL